MTIAGMNFDESLGSVRLPPTIIKLSKEDMADVPNEEDISPLAELITYFLIVFVSS